MASRATARPEQEMSFSVNPFHDLSSVLHSGERFAGVHLVQDGAKGF